MPPKKSVRPVDQFGIFAKHWQPGQVKTRLAKAIGAQPASELYLCFLQTLLRRFRAVGDSRVLSFSPPDSLDAFRELAGDDWRLIPQQGAHLGERMSDYFQTAFAGGVERAVLIGSDSPHLPQQFVEKAFLLLRSHPVVLGPSHDGGYYLIGAAHETPPIFDVIDWSTPRVWRQTVDKLQQANIEFAELPPFDDVDDEADLRQLHADLALPAGADPKLRQAVDRALSHLSRSAE